MLSALLMYLSGVKHLTLVKKKTHQQEEPKKAALHRIILEEVPSPCDVKKHHYHESQHKEALHAEQNPAELASLSQIHVCHNQKLILQELGFPFLSSGYPLFMLIQ